MFNCALRTIEDLDIEAACVRARLFSIYECITPEKDTAVFRKCERF